MEKGVNGAHAEPTEKNMFKAVGDNFMKRWQFPNCIVCIDGKHIRIREQKKSGSRYYCYKNFTSIVLLAATDVNHRFVMIDVGS